MARVPAVTKKLIYKDHRAIVKLKRSIGRPENKFFDLANQNNTFTTGATYVLSPIFDVGQGVTNVLRLGNEVSVKKIELNMMFFCAPVVTAGGIVVGPYDQSVDFRLTVLTEKAIGSARAILGTTMLATDLYQAPAANPVYTPYAISSQEEGKQFRIIFRKSFNIGVVDSPGKALNKALRFKTPLPVKWVDNTTTHHSTNRIYVMIECNLANNNSVPQIDWYSRVTFSDD